VTFAPENRQNVTVPAHKPIKPVYVRQFLAMIDSVCGNGGTNDS
jgi:hypothetical protein